MSFSLNLTLGLFDDRGLSWNFCFVFSPPVSRLLTLDDMFDLSSFVPWSVCHCSSFQYVNVWVCISQKVRFMTTVCMFWVQIWPVAWFLPVTTVKSVRNCPFQVDSPVNPIGIYCLACVLLRTVLSDRFRYGFACALIKQSMVVYPLYSILSISSILLNDPASYAKLSNKIWCQLLGCIRFHWNFNQFFSITNLNVGTIKKKASCFPVGNCQFSVSVLCSRFL